MEFTNKNFLWFCMGCILILGAARFVYSISVKSLFSASYTENILYIMSEEEGTSRKWGPVFIALINGAKKLAPDGNQKGIEHYCESHATLDACKSYTSLIWKAGLLVAYGLIIYFLLKLISEFKSLLTGNAASNNYFWNCFLIFVALQSTPAIIGIIVGQGDILSAFFVSPFISV